MSIIQQAVGAVVGRLPAKPSDPLIGRWGAVGRPVSRIDGPLKVAGQARFTAEYRPEGMAYAAPALSTIARGRITRIDTDAALAVPGVVTVITYENAPRLAPPPVMDGQSQSSSPSSVPVLQDAEIWWNGQPIALVVAETQQVAWYAASLIRAEYEVDEPATDFAALLDTAAPPEQILGEPAEVKKGDAEAALAAAARKVDRVYETTRTYHAAMEPHAVVAEWRDDAVTIHDTSQTIDATRWTLAQIFGVAEDKIRVLAPYVGGAFGNKGVWQHQVLAIAASRMIGRPVRLVMTREQVFRMTGARTLTRQRVALALKEDGNGLASLIHTGVTGVTSHSAWPEQFSFPARHLYAADNYLIAQEQVELDMVANTAMRAPGESIGTFALESAIDELAHDMGRDPIALRAAIEPECDPTTGKAFSSRRLIEAYRLGAERFGWAARSAVPRTRQEAGWWIGQGVATATYPYYRMPGGAARITISADSTATIACAAHEMGMGTATAQGQAAADRLGLSYDQVTFIYGDSDLPLSPLAGGSSQTASIAAAVLAAADELKAAMLKLAGNDSPLAGAGVDDVELADAGLRRSDTGEHESYASILSRAGRDSLECQASASMPAEMMRFSMHSTGAQFCEVRVNEATGEIRVSRFLGCFDVGTVLNPKLVTSQFYGGITMGLGLALTEDMLFDRRNGRFANASLAEYHVPVNADVPRIEAIWVGTPDPHSPFGARGVGEIGITGVAAAVANAVFNATGKRIRSLPLTLDKVLAAEPLA